MSLSNHIIDLWNKIDQQLWEELPAYFTDNAVINWINSGEQFNVEEFVIANKEYPGKWNIEIERIEETGNLIISVVKVSLHGEAVSFHATSFFEFRNDKIIMLNEYWGLDENPPQWRIDRKIGKPIISREIVERGTCNEKI